MKSEKNTKKIINGFTGIVQANERGFAFILPDDKTKYPNDFFVPRSSLCGAFNGDKVLAVPVKGTKDEAKIVRITERCSKPVIGTYERGKVYPDDLRMPEVTIPTALKFNAKNGDKVVCEICTYRKSGLPSGKVTEVLGESGDFEVEELSIIRAHGLNEQFPQSVIDEADSASGEKIQLNARRDLREKLIFTIDGADTRDVDDAVSLEFKDGNYVLGVHIADASHYVKYKSVIDEEAYARGTSVYFPDRVLPMLPQSLSNGACSLNEGEDRYALSCSMTFDKDGIRQSY